MNESSFIRQAPSFLLLWLGQILSQSGGRMYQMAMIWWLLSFPSENSGVLIGIFMVLTALPSVLFVKPIGSLIDRTPSKRTLIITDLLACLTVGIVSLLLHTIELPLVGAMAAGFLASVLQAIIDPTLNKAVNDVVPKEKTESGVTLLSSTQSLANFGGAVLGAMLIAWLGVAGTAFLASLGYLMSSLCTSVARFRYAMIPVTGGGGEVDTSRSVFSIYPELKKILFGFGLINFFATPTLVVLPIYTKRTLMGTPSTLGLLEASLWIGLLSGTFGTRFFTYSGHRVKLGATCLFTFGLSLLIPALWVSTALYQAALFIGGAAIGINNVKFMAFFQDVVTSEMKGRFFAVMQATIGFTFPIAYFLFGLLMDLFSPPQVCLVQSVGVLSLAIGFLSLTSAEDSLNRKPQKPLAGEALWQR